MKTFRKKCARRFSKRKLLGLSVLILCLSILSGTTLAYLIAGAGPITNLFSPGEVSCKVSSTFDATVPTDVTVQNTGTVSAYIRATVVANWVDQSGTISVISPVEGYDYTITYPENSGWEQAADGFWYYTSPVAPGASTEKLMDRCINLKTVAPEEGYHLSVQVMASAIQATPETVVKDSWSSGVSSLANSNLTIKEVAQP